MNLRASILFGLSALLFATPPAQAEIIKRDDNAFVTRDSAVVNADKRAVWLALISPARWWNKSHTFSGDAANLSLTPSAGGCFCETIPANDTAGSVGLAGSVEHMRVILAIPDQALRLHGNLGPLQSEPVDGVLTVTLADVEGNADATRLIFEYAVGGYMRFETPVIAKAVD
ncbi:MAG: SRPBCC family protein, partial [Pontixanthobacter sp.]